ncbi:MAG: DUF1573 domain-containing protein [Planctomycetaceae bacterium]|nr:DUF1573 domain-containing protein [Planctomycetaceae bacterium]
MDAPSKDSNQRRFLLLSAAVPIIWSTIAAAWPAVPQSVPAVDPLPSLAFDQYLVNRRDVGLAPVIMGEYHFTNTGAEPLTITDLDPSCGCLRPRLMLDEEKKEKNTYQPGESGYFVVGVTTANEVPGPHTYSVKVNYQDPQSQQTTVRFKVNLPEKKVTVDPPQLAIYQNNSQQQPNQATVYVTDYRGNEIAVTDATSNSDVIDVEVQTPVVDEHGNTRVPVVLHVPSVVPVGRAVSQVTIKTNDPEFSVIRIPVLVEGYEITPVSASEEATGLQPPRRP